MHTNNTFIMDLILIIIPPILGVNIKNYLKVLGTLKNLALTPTVAVFFYLATHMRIL